MDFTPDDVQDEGIPFVGICEDFVHHFFEFAGGTVLEARADEELVLATELSEIPPKPELEDHPVVWSVGVDCLELKSWILKAIHELEKDIDGLRTFGDVDALDSFFWANGAAVIVCAFVVHEAESWTEDGFMDVVGPHRLGASFDGQVGPGAGVEHPLQAFGAGCVGEAHDGVDGGLDEAGKGGLWVFKSLVSRTKSLTVLFYAPNSKQANIVLRCVDSSRRRATM